MNNIITEAKIKFIAERAAYKIAEGALKVKIEKTRAQLKRLEERRHNLYHPSWIDSLVKPIAEAMVKHFPDRTFEILGPCGMSSETAIHFYKKGIVRKDQFKGDNCISITFRPGTDLPDLTVVDELTDTKRYKPGSIAEMNGMNYLAFPIQDDIKWLLSFMLRKPKEAKLNATKTTSHIHTV